MDFVKLIRDELKRQGLPQAEIVRRTGMTKARVSDYLNAKRDVTAGTLRKIFLALDIQVLPASKPEKADK